jgi:hypothetical protein
MTETQTGKYKANFEPVFLKIDKCPTRLFKIKIFFVEIKSFFDGVGLHPKNHLLKSDGPRKTINDTNCHRLFILGFLRLQGRLRDVFAFLFVPFSVSRYDFFTKHKFKP